MSEDAPPQEPYKGNAYAVGSHDDVLRAHGYDPVADAPSQEEAIPESALGQAYQDYLSNNPATDKTKPFSFEDWQQQNPQTAAEAIVAGDETVATLDPVAEVVTTAETGIPTEADNKIEAQNQRIAQLEAKIDDLTEQVQLLMDHLTAPADKTTETKGKTADTATTKEQNDNTLKELMDTARDDLVKITIRRKARMGDRFTFNREGGKADKEAFDKAMQEYQAAQTVLAEDIKAAGEAAGKSPEDIRKDIIAALYQERRDFAERELKVNNDLLQEEIDTSGPLKSRALRLLRGWAKLSTKKKLAIGLGLGVSAAVLGSTAGLGLAGLAAASAAKFSLGLLNRRASLRNVAETSKEKDIHKIRLAEDRTLANGLVSGAGEEELSSRLDWEISTIRSDHEGRVVSAQRRNRIGNALLVVSGVTAGLGALGVDLVPNLHLFGGHGGGDAARHTDYYNHGMSNPNPSPFELSHGLTVGHDTVGVGLPSGLHLSQETYGGISNIVDSHGNTIVNHFDLPKGMFNEQGGLSEAAKGILKSKGFDLSQLPGTKLTSVG